MNIMFGLAFVISLTAFVSIVFQDIGLTMIFNPDAFFIVVGGTVLAVFVGFPFKRISDTMHDIVNTFKSKTDRETVINDILDLARMYRKSDIRGIDRRMKGIKDDFLRLGGNLLINHHKNENIRSIMEREMTIRIINYNFSQNMLKTIARLTPAFGLAGTVISLIKMFKSFQSVETMAPLMAVALMSTFYGVIISNLFILPLSAKLKENSIMSETLMNITIEGIEAVNNLEHPLIIEDRIKGYHEIRDSGLTEVGNVLAASKGAN